jgi:hypothetical protein
MDDDEGSSGMYAGVTDLRVLDSQEGFLHVNELARYRELGKKYRSNTLPGNYARLSPLAEVFSQTQCMQR